jgi:hypothetical protein
MFVSFVKVLAPEKYCMVIYENLIIIRSSMNGKTGCLSPNQCSDMQVVRETVGSFILSLSTVPFSQRLLPFSASHCSL